MRRASLFALLVLVVAWHAHGLWQTRRPLAPAEAAALLRAGLADRGDRQRSLAALRDADGNDPRTRILAVAAALALGDAAAHERLVTGELGDAEGLARGVGRAWPEPDALDATLAEVALGEHWLEHFFRGQWLRARGDPAARRELAAAAETARWSGADLGREVALASLGSLPEEPR